MPNDVIKFNTIVNEIGGHIAELTEFGQGGFNAPLIMTPDEMAEMVGYSMGPWRPNSNDLLWFYAFKTTVYARHMLEQSARIFRQMDDDELAQRVQNIVATIDSRFHPCETALQVYSKLLHLNTHNGANLNQ